MTVLRKRIDGTDREITVPADAVPIYKRGGWSAVKGAPAQPSTVKPPPPKPRRNRRPTIKEKS